MLVQKGRNKSNKKSGHESENYKRPTGDVNER
jgi:hypothetical protein